MNMNWFYNLRLRWKLVVVFGVVFAVAIVQSALTYRAVQASESSRAGTQRAYAVIEAVTEAHNALDLVETGYRSYLATGKDAALANYTRGWESFGAKLDELRRTTGDDPIRAAALDDLRQKAEQLRSQVTDPGVRTRRPDAAAAMDESGMADLRAAMGKDMALERRLLVAGVDAGARRDAVASRVLVWGTLLAILVTIIAAVVFERGINWPVNELGTKMDALAKGDVDVEVWITSKDEMGDLANALRRIIVAQREFAQVAEHLGAGDISVAVRPRSDRDVVSHSFQQMIDALGGLTREVQGLIHAAKGGDLTKRGDAQRYRGTFRELVLGFNQTLEAVTEPVHESAQVLEQVAARDLRVRVRGEYQGEHAKIKAALNAALSHLDDALGEVAISVEQVAAGAAQVSSGSRCWPRAPVSRPARSRRSRARSRRWRR